MTRMAFLKKYVFRIAASVVLAGLLFYIGYHVFFASSKAPNTVPTRSITDYQILGGQGYLFREESVMRVPQEGLLNTLQKSGEKVSKGAILCEVWDGYGREELAAAQREMNRLQTLISVLESSEDVFGASLIKAEQYRTEAIGHYQAISRSVNGGEWQSVEALEDELLTSLSRYQALTGNESAMRNALTAAEQARDALLKGNRVLVLNDRASGYFYDSTYVDGYEEIFTPAALENLDAEALASMIAAPRPEQTGFAVGKLVTGSTWYLAIPFSQDVSPFFEVGEVYEVTLPDNADRTMNMRCEKLTVSENGTSLAVLSSREISPDFIFLRSQRVEVAVGACHGYYVPESALYTVDGVEGVYIFEDSTAYFRYIEILYRGDGYVILAEQGDRGELYLALYDVMILSGQNLYHGKVFR